MAYATRAASRGWTVAAAATSLHDHHVTGGLTDRALDLLVVGVPDQEHRVAAAGVAAHLGVHLRDERAGRVDHREVPGRRLRPHGGGDAVRGEHHPRSRAAPRRSPGRTPRRAPAARAPRARCARSGAARTPGRRSGSSARSTMSIARSTPAQNERGSASSTVRSPVAASQSRSAGAARRRARRATTPRTGGAGPRERALRGVDDRADHRERPTGGGGREPRGLHVDGERPAGARRLAGGTGDQRGAGEHRPDVHGEPEPAQGRRERHRRGHGDRPVGPADLVGHHDVARPQPGCERPGHPGHQHRAAAARAQVGRRGRRTLPAHAGRHHRHRPDPAPERVPLDGQRRADDRGPHPWAPFRYRPSAETGKTIRYRW